MASLRRFYLFLKSEPDATLPGSGAVALESSCWKKVLKFGTGNKDVLSSLYFFEITELVRHAYFVRATAAYIGKL
jgi:hypothetical protein